MLDSFKFCIKYFIFGIVPLADYILGVDVANQSKEEQKILNKYYGFKLFTLLIPICVAGVIAAGAYFFLALVVAILVVA